ncbi:MAG TPA: sugar phosphate nucleotidyltransferase, partial [Anaerolineales bacterium]|nr:sugar phosphate nucleotidyltransferase [Anaerolineales bacterium]
TRIAPLPCSKELFPIGFQSTADGKSVRPKPVGQYLLEHYRRAGARRVHIVIRRGKWDIPEYFGDGSSLDLSLSYQIMRLPHGAPYTIDQAYDFVREATIVFGFPDILIEPQDAFPRLIAHLDETRADLALGLFPTDQPHLCDPIIFDDDGRIREILVKPPHSDLRFTWTIAAWTPSFTQFLHEQLIVLEQEAAESSSRSEVYMSHIINAALQAGLRVEGLHLPGARFLDIGVPENLVRAMRMQLDTM